MGIEQLGWKADFFLLRLSVGIVCLNETNCLHGNFPVSEWIDQFCESERSLVQKVIAAIFILRPSLEMRESMVRPWTTFLHGWPWDGAHAKRWVESPAQLMQALLLLALKPPTILHSFGCAGVILRYTENYAMDHSSTSFCDKFSLFGVDGCILVFQCFL